MIIKKIIIDFYTILRSIWIVGKQIFNKRETILYPEEKIQLSKRFRGKIVLTCDDDGNERCVACGLCSVVCPVGCISLQKGQTNNGRWYAKFFRINFSRCIFCGLCEEACPTAAIQLTTDFEMSEFNREDLIYEKNDLLVHDSGKYPEYNFYDISGVSISGKDKDKRKNDCNIIDVKEILP